MVSGMAEPSVPVVRAMSTVTPAKIKESGVTDGIGAVAAVKRAPAVIVR